MATDRTILVQTDFTVNSLNLIIKALESAPDSEQVTLVLGYGINLTDSITELLFFSEAKLLSALRSEHFDEALDVIRNRYSKNIRSIEFKLFSGYTNSAFKNYVSGIGITEAFVDRGLEMTLPRNRSFDINPYILKSSLPTTEVLSDKVINVYDKVHFAWG